MSDPGESAARVYIFVFEDTPKKLILKSIFPLKVDTTLFSGSRKVAAGYRYRSYMLTL